MKNEDMSISYKSKRSDFPTKYSDWDFDSHKVRLFQEQMEGWVINVAKEIKDKKIGHADFAVLAILLSYFENIAKYIDGYDGEFDSKKYFVKGVRSVYPRKFKKLTIELFYKQARNGMYHIGLTGTKLILDCTISAGIVYKKKRFIVCPEKMIEEIQRHFSQYCVDLKNTSNRELRANFEKRAKFIWQA